jgi:adenine-specific DNA-methyltransferase
VLNLNHQSGSTRRFILIERGRPDRGDSYARTLLADRLHRVITGNWANGKGAPVPGGFRFVELQKKVDADAVLLMERDEMLDTVIASHYDSGRRRGPGLVSLVDEGYQHLIARNSDSEGFFLIWDGPDRNTNFTEDVYEAIAEEAKKAGMSATYHVYARLYLFQTDTVRFYQIPDRILADFGLNLSSEPLHEDA